MLLLLLLLLLLGLQYGWCRLQSSEYINIIIVVVVVVIVVGDGGGGGGDRGDQVVDTGGGAESRWGSDHWNNTPSSPTNAVSTDFTKRRGSAGGFLGCCGISGGRVGVAVAVVGDGIVVVVVIVVVATKGR